MEQYDLKDKKMERETRFEPATLSLEGWCSTNWATPAHNVRLSPNTCALYQSRIEIAINGLSSLPKFLTTLIPIIVRYLTPNVTNRPEKRTNRQAVKEAMTKPWFYPPESLDHFVLRPNEFIVTLPKWEAGNHFPPFPFRRGKQNLYQETLFSFINLRKPYSFQTKSHGTSEKKIS